MILPIFQGSVFSNIFICCIGEPTLIVRHSNKNDRSVLPMDFMITLPSAKPVGLLAKRCHEYHDFTWYVYMVDRYVRDPLTVTV